MTTHFRAATTLMVLPAKVVVAVCVAVLLCAAGCSNEDRPVKPEGSAAQQEDFGDGEEMEVEPDEMTPRGFDAPTERDGHQVTVLYGTCRAVVVSPASWWMHFKGFVWTSQGLVTVAVLVIVVLVGMIWRGFQNRLSGVRAATIIGICLVVYASAAAIDAAWRVGLDKKPGGVYGNLRGELRYGLCTVSVPEHHERGKLETPFSFYVVHMPEDPKKHFVLERLEENRDRFFQELSDRVAASQKKEAFVFIHGYNVSFSDAVKRTAQLNVDLDFSGAPICFTWPSKGDLKDYIADSNTARVAAEELLEFLTDVEAQSGAKTIHLIAHSMGTFVLTEALKEMDRQQLASERSVFREILLAAPDIDADYFEKKIVPALANDRQHITLYASSNDKALNASYKLSSYPRAGMAGAHLLVLDKIDTVDVSALDTDFFGHSTYGDHILAVQDIGAILTQGLRPPKRGLQQREKNGRHYWAFAR